MDRDLGAAGSLMDQEMKLIAEILGLFRMLVRDATDKVNSTASTGKAASNSMAIEIRSHDLIKSIEHLLALTRRLRELWVVGPLRIPGDGDAMARESIRQDADAFFGMLNAMRKEERMSKVQESHGSMAYADQPLEGPPVHIKSEGGR